MKKKLLLLALGALFVKTAVFSQELIVGGDMEDASQWTFFADGGAPDATVEPIFNYDLDSPTGGDGGCLNLRGYGQTSAFLYQKVAIIPGHTYTFDGLVKNISADVLTNQWIELNLTKIEPETGAKDDSAFYSYASNSWMAAPYNDFSSFDGDFFSVSQFLWKKVLEGSKDSLLASKEFTIPTTETVTDWYVVIKTGCWNTQGDNMPTFDFVFDNISLKDNANTSIAIDNAMDIFNVYPNPSYGIVNFESTSQGFVKYELYNTLGSLVKSGNVANQLDITSMKKGAYIIKLDNNSSVEYHQLILK